VQCGQPPHSVRGAKQELPDSYGLYGQGCSGKNLLPCGIVIVLDLGRCLQVRVGVNIFRVSERLQSQRSA